MRIKILAEFLCCLVLISCEINDRQNTVEKQKGIPRMSKQTIEQVQEKYQNQWMVIPGVVGVGIGAVDDKPVIKVLVVKKTPALEQKIPKKVDGYTVVIEETGEIRMLK
jgi:hypothetical protein